MPKGIFDRIYTIVRRIPPGRVATYGQIAMLAGMPRGARIVGYAMASAPDDHSVPCHRVVDSRGGCKAAFDVLTTGTQRAMLEAEGVRFTAEGRVDLACCLWQPD